MALREKIKKIRLENGMTQKEFAKELGVTQATVSGWERGLSEPEDYRLKEIAQQGNISIAELEQENMSLINWIEHQIGEVKVENILAGDEYTQGRLDALQDVETLINKKK